MASKYADRVRKARRKGRRIAEADWDYADVTTRLKFVLTKNNFEFSFQFSQTSESLYVIASRGKRVIKIRVASHVPPDERGQDMSFSPQLILNGTFEERFNRMVHS
jgi:hypothetical protein